MNQSVAAPLMTFGEVLEAVEQLRLEEQESLLGWSADVSWNIVEMTLPMKYDWLTMSSRQVGAGLLRWVTSCRKYSHETQVAAVQFVRSGRTTNGESSTLHSRGYPSGSGALGGADAFDPRLQTHKLHGKLQGAWASGAGYDLRIVFKNSPKSHSAFSTGVWLGF